MSLQATRVDIPLASMKHEQIHQAMEAMALQMLADISLNDVHMHFYVAASSSDGSAQLHLPFLERCCE